MAIELDHVFVNVKEGFPEKETLNGNLRIGHRSKHKDQGTEVEFLAFEKNYLEFIWLSDKEEASKNPLKLNERFLANQCPFGVGYRGVLDAEQKSEFWEYKPEYMKAGTIWVHNSALEDFSLPMVFVVELGVDNKSMWPSRKKTWSPDQILSGGFNEVVISGPLDPNELVFPQLKFMPADTYSMQIAGVESLRLDTLNITNQSSVTPD